ncbi:alpha/beta hydrolase [Nocardioides sp. NPDC047086]|uniref:alpha/beta fold hydrolase n=1 Tax=Nocardioides sp. NPDC047086 TaxID=3154810 RepID=UPI00340DC950
MPETRDDQRAAMTGAIVQQSRMVHGYRRAYRIGGDGSAIMFIHGIGDSSQTWEDVLPLLAENHLVIAPDLLGHGDSDKPRADYSVGGFANGMRDLLAVLDVERVTLVGHSLGRGIAMQLAYQYPQLVERIVLVSNDGSGQGVSTWLRLATLPMAPEVLQLLRLPVSRTGLSAPPRPAAPHRPRPRCRRPGPDPDPRRAARRPVPPGLRPDAARRRRRARPGRHDARP